MLLRSCGPRATTLLFATFAATLFVSDARAQTIDETVNFVETFVAGKALVQPCGKVTKASVSLKFDRKTKQLTEKVSADGAVTTYTSAMNKVNVTLIDTIAWHCNSGRDVVRLEVVCDTPGCHVGPRGAFNISYWWFDTSTDAQRALSAFKRLAELSGASTKAPPF